MRREMLLSSDFTLNVSSLSRECALFISWCRVTQDPSCVYLLSVHEVNVKVHKLDDGL